MPASKLSNTAKFYALLNTYDEEDMKVLRFSSTEGLSKLFSVSLELASRDPEVKVQDVIGKEGTFCLGSEELNRYMHGVVTSFHMVGSTAGHTMYGATIRPRMWLLTQRINCRIFQEKTVPEIVKEVLNDHGIAGDQLSVELNEDYETREYCVQYRESDYDFVCRLLKDEAIYFGFESDKDKTTLFLTDHVDRPVIEGEDSLRFAPPGGMAPEDGRDQVFEFSVNDIASPNTVVTRGYDIEKPHEMIEATASMGDGNLDQFDPWECQRNADLGQVVAANRLYEHYSRQTRMTGTSNCLALLPGRIFTLEEHPQTLLNSGYLVVEASMSGQSPQALEEDVPTGTEAEFSCSFEVLQEGYTFQNELRTPRPRMHGVQLALVVGSENAEIETDEYGRIRVMFRWDREATGNADSSCWIRVAQPWAGGEWGFLAIPRVGQEVVVDFIEGDPDRPIVVGSVYNGEQMPPQTLDQHKSRMTLRSQSLGGSGGFNEITLDDKENGENFYVHAEKDLNEVVKNTRTRSVGSDESVSVGGDRSHSVDGSETLTIGVDRELTVAAESKHTVGASHDQAIQADRKIRVGASSLVEIGTDITSRAGGNSVQEVTGDHAKTVGGAEDKVVSGPVSLSCGSSRETSVSDSDTLDATGPIHLTSGQEIKLTAGAASLTLKADGTIELAGVQVKVNAGATLDLVASGITSIKGLLVKMN